MLSIVTAANWTIRRLGLGEPVEDEGKNLVRVTIEVAGSSDPASLLQLIGDAKGVRFVGFIAQEDLD